MADNYFYNIVGKTVLECLILHLIHLNEGESVQISKVLEYVRSRTVAELDSALLSEQDERVSSLWQIFKGYGAETPAQVREKVLSNVQITLGMLHDESLCENQVKHFINRVYADTQSVSC